MARRSRPQDPEHPTRSTVVVCRGGDCGSRRKHPGFDHLGQLRELQSELASTCDVVPSACLDACEHSNVIVVVPGRAASTAGEQPTWIGQATDAAITEDVVAWMRAGDPRAAERPALVDIQEFRPTRMNREALDEAMELVEQEPTKKRGRRRRG